MVCRAIRNIGIQVRTENMELSVSSAIADAAVNSPNVLKAPAITVGYTGPSHAVAPVSGGNGEENPLPVVRERPTIPISHAKRQCPCHASSRSGYRNIIVANRTASPAAMA
jgi:hypothetical protein